MRRAVGHVNDVIAPSVVDMDADDQRALDTRLVELDGTSNKGRLGANALLAVSLAACRAAAASRRIPLYRRIADLAGVGQPTVPLPMINIISGGLHAGAQIDIQDVLAVPTGAHSFAEALEQVSTVYLAVADRVAMTGNQPLVADEGGWAPRLQRNEDALRWVADALAETGREVAIAVDVASTRFFRGRENSYFLEAESRHLDAAAMVALLGGWADRYPIVSIEDGLAEDDWAGWELLTATLGNRLQILGDDLFTTHPGRLRRGIEQNIANAVLIKVNQIGTLSEALDVIDLARAAGYRTVVSARSGETEDTFLADLAVGTAAGQIKVGSLARSERLAKWNQLLRIEEELGHAAYVGRAALRLG